PEQGHVEMHQKYDQSIGMTEQCYCCIKNIFRTDVYRITKRLSGFIGPFVKLIHPSSTLKKE
ncbi:hypothetical protein NPIL_607811, partial [Nephila pilipes]